MHDDDLLISASDLVKREVEIGQVYARLRQAERLLRREHEARYETRTVLKCMECGGEGESMGDCEHVSECEAGEIRAFLEAS